MKIKKKRSIFFKNGNKQHLRSFYYLRKEKNIVLIEPLVKSESDTPNQLLLLPIKTPKSPALYRPMLRAKDDWAI